MELKFLTPTEVWEGYNPVKEPLETSIVSSEETDNFARIGLFYTSETTASGRVRVYSDIIYDARWTDERATLLLVPALNQEMDYALLTRTLVAEGYVVAIVDYCGNFHDNIRRTTFPQEYSYASAPECNGHLDTIEQDARHTPWFQWTKIIRRTISMLQEHRLVSKDRIGVVGVGVGAQLAWQAAGIDGRVRALVPINGGGYLWQKGKARFESTNLPTSDEERAFSTGVGAETYARFVSCPTFVMTSSNSDYFDVDRAGDIFSLVPAESKQLLISNGGEEQITKKAFSSLIIWLRNNFALDGKPSPQPTVEFKQIENKLYLKINTAKKAPEKNVYVCYGEPHPFARYWKKLDGLQKTEHHEYVCPVPVEDENELIVAYASFVYENGNYLSTPVIGVVPTKIGAERDEHLEYASPRIIYNGSMGLGSFCASTRDVFLDEEVLQTAKGPYGISGILTTDGDLVLSRSKHEIENLDSSTAFCFDAYSAAKREICVKILAVPEMKYYCADVVLDGGEFWQRVLLENTSFKSAEGRTLQRFKDGKLCVFSNAANVVFNNLLWI